MMKTMTTMVCLAGLMTFAEAALAIPPGIAGHCFGQTVRLADGESADAVSVRSCNRALRMRTISRNDRSLAYHNRGIIEEAQEKRDAAYASFTRSVALSRTVDMRNVALAQLAFKRGDYIVALKQYELLQTADAKGLSKEVLAIVARNKRRVLDALRQTQYAQRSDRG